MIRRARFLLPVACALGLAVSAWGAPPRGSTIPVLKTPDLSGLKPYAVTRIVDGDTIVVSSDGRQLKVRLIGVNTPDIADPDDPIARYRKEATRFATNLLKGEKVYLVFDKQTERLDVYGRTLAYVYRAPDGLFVNAEIVRQGYGRAYTRHPFKHLKAFRQLERFARHAEKGLWMAAAAVSTTAPVRPPSVVKPEPKPGGDEVIVYVTRSGNKYHRSTCSYLRKSRMPVKRKDAKAAGYTSCSRCKPPE